MGQPAVLLIGGLAHCNQEWSDLESKYKLKEFRTGSREQFLNNCKNGEYDDVVAICRSNESVAQTGLFDQELVTALPKSVRYICHNGAGYDNIDVEAVTQRGLLVSSTPIAVDEATADVGIFIMLGALRQAGFVLQSLQKGEWKTGAKLGHDPKGKILGILGMGGIGRSMARKARAFGMTIIYHNRSRLSSELEAGAKYVSFDELLSKADVLSLNLSLNPKTRHIISAKEFEKMKDGVVIVNTARGALINEKDLVAALENGKVGGAGLDVFENEPKIEPGLLNNRKVFAVPHIGTMTYETQRDMELLVFKNLVSAVDEGKLLTPIAEQQKKSSN